MFRGDISFPISEMGWNVRKFTIRPQPASGEGMSDLAILVNGQDVAALSSSSNVTRSQTEYVVTAQCCDLLHVPNAMAKMFAARSEAVVVRDLETCRRLK